jgi:single-strand DNA-binding protein
MQQLTLAGTVGRDAELRRTHSGDAVLNFSLAIDNGKDKDGNKRDATWFDCSLWGKRAEALQSYVLKGGKLTVTGRPSAREHKGKVYLGCTVQELTFMGGGNRDSQQGGGYDQSPQGYGSGGRPSDDFQDDIPFAAEWRI